MEQKRRRFNFNFSFNLAEWSTKKKVLVGCVLVLVAFLTWFLISYFTIEAKLEVVNLFRMPAAESLEDLVDIEVGNFAVAVDGQTIVGGDLLNEMRPTASLAKMILGLAVMEAKPFELGESGETITITPEFYQKYIWYVNNDGSNTPVYEGEEISEYDALVSVFLASSNNMADSLAIWAFGSLEAYREYATEMLGRLEILDTTVGEDASGFSATTTSTPSDLARLGFLVLENPVLREIVGMVEAEVPAAGVIRNTNLTLGKNGILGVKTGFIGEASGYCLVSGYDENGHFVTIALLNTATREDSFNKSLALVGSLKKIVRVLKMAEVGDVVGYYDSWWTGPVAIRAKEDFSEMIYAEADFSSEIAMDGQDGVLNVRINLQDYAVPVEADEINLRPSFIDKVKHIFGWQKGGEAEFSESGEIVQEDIVEETIEEIAPWEEVKEINESAAVTTGNCTTGFGSLMLVNPNFMVDSNFIAARRGELISLSANYGIPEYNHWNGDNLLDPEAASHLNGMIRAYEADYPGHTMGTLSCFRSVGVNCGRMCAATGASDHHTGYTCDLVDSVYGLDLDTDYYNSRPDWQWLRANSYKYGFIDRFPEAWAGGPMSAPINVDANGTTGLYETWHYRYVGVAAATEIATGAYNGGAYDSLEHYLKARGMVTDLVNGRCR